jgi:hypothetical protein
MLMIVCALAVAASRVLAARAAENERLALVELLMSLILRVNLYRAKHNRLSGKLQMTAGLSTRNSYSR